MGSYFRLDDSYTYDYFPRKRPFIYKRRQVAGHEMLRAKQRVVSKRVARDGVSVRRQQGVGLAEEEMHTILEYIVVLDTPPAGRKVDQFLQTLTSYATTLP